MPDNTIKVTTDDVLNRWLPANQAPTTHRDRIELLIEDLTDDAREHIKDFDNKIAEGKIRPTTLKRVIAGAIIRIWKLSYDPRSSYAETVGPYSQSGSYNASTERTATLTDKELDRLDPTRKSGTITLFPLTPESDLPTGNWEVWIA